LNKKSESNSTFFYRLILVQSIENARFPVALLAHDFSRSLSGFGHEEPKTEPYYYWRGTRLSPIRAGVANGFVFIDSDLVMRRDE